LTSPIWEIFGRNIDQVRRVQDIASDKVEWILSSRLHLGAHLGNVFFRIHFLQGLLTRYPISKSYLYLKFFLVIFLPCTREKIESLSHDFQSHKSKTFLKNGCTRPFWQMISRPVPGLGKTPLYIHCRQPGKGSDSFRRAAS